MPKPPYLHEGINDLASRCPSVSKQWHPTRNGDLTPESVTVGSNRKVWWICQNDHQYPAVIANRARGSGCPVCAGFWILRGYNDLATRFPEIASEWFVADKGKKVTYWDEHQQCFKKEYKYYTELKPCDVTPGSRLMVEWICRRSGFHMWSATVYNRTKGTGCPKCSSGRTSSEKKNVANTDPELIDKWWDRENNTISPSSIDRYYKEPLHWVCEKEKSHQWTGRIINEIRRKDCPFCSGRKYVQNQIPYQLALRDTHDDLDRELLEKRSGFLSDDVTQKSQRPAWWKCSICSHVWKATVRNRAIKGTGCPACSGKVIVPGKNDLASQCPDLMKEWHSDNTLDPTTLAKQSNKSAKWQCEKGHTWEAKINHRFRGTKCQECRREKSLRNN